MSSSQQNNDPLNYNVRNVFIFLTGCVFGVLACLECMYTLTYMLSLDRVTFLDVAMVTVIQVVILFLMSITGWTIGHLHERKR